VYPKRTNISTTGTCTSGKTTPRDFDVSRAPNRTASARGDLFFGNEWRNGTRDDQRGSPSRGQAMNNVQHLAEYTYDQIRLH